MIEKYVNETLEQIDILERKLDAKRQAIKDLEFEIDLFDRRRKEIYYSLKQWNIVQPSKLFDLFKCQRDKESLTKEHRQTIDFMLYMFMEHDDIKAFKPKFVDITVFWALATYMRSDLS